MSITVPVYAVSKAVNAAMKFVEPRSTMPILTMIHLKLDDGGVMIVEGNDLSKAIRVNVGVSSDEVFDVCLPSKQFSEIVSGLNSAEIELKPNGAKSEVKIKSGSVKATFRGVSGEEFPVTITEDGWDESVTLNVAKLVPALKRVIFSASSDESHPVLCGVLFELAGGTLTLAAADGFRASVDRLKIEGEEDGAWRAIVPSSALSDLVGLLSSYDGEVVKMSLHENQMSVRFDCGDAWSMTSQLFSGIFPDYERIIPKSEALSVTVNRALALNAIKRALVFGRSAANIVTFNIDPTASTVVISAQGVEVGEGETALTLVDHVGSDGMAIAFNGTFLVEALGAATSENVVLKLNSPQQPGTIEEAGYVQWKHVVMPMHLGK